MLFWLPGRRGRLRILFALFLVALDLENP